MSALSNQEIWVLRQCFNATCLALSVATAWAYDFLGAIPEEIRMFTETSVVVADIAYMLARSMSAACVVTLMVFASMPSMGHCQGLLAASTWAGAIAMPCNSLLLFLRILGIYHNSRKIQVAFAILWASTCLSFVVPFSYQGATEGSDKSRWCWVPEPIHTMAAAPFIALTIFDTAVLVAITVRVLSLTPVITMKEKFRVMFFAKDIGRVSKTLLRSGQIYYTMTVGVNIFVAAVVISNNKSISPMLRAIIAIFNIAFQNIMTCLVFRLLRFGIIDSDRPTTLFFPFKEAPLAAHLRLAHSYSTESVPQEIAELQRTETEEIDAEATGFDTHPTWNIAPRSPQVEITVVQETQVLIDPEPVGFTGSESGHSM